MFKASHDISQMFFVHVFRRNFKMRREQLEKLNWTTQESFTKTQRWILRSSKFRCYYLFAYALYSRSKFMLFESWLLQNAFAPHFIHTVKWWCIVAISGFPRISSTLESDSFSLCFSYFANVIYLTWCSPFNHWRVKQEMTTIFHDVFISLLLLGNVSTEQNFYNIFVTFFSLPLDTYKITWNDSASLITILYLWKLALISPYL